MNIRNQLAFGGKTIPTKSDALVWLDGTISESNFVDKISGRLFPIANKDFPTGWVKGFPYKSAATFSAPVGDTALIAADVNGFFYTAGTPNQIPVISCFQDVDYEHRLFFRHISQSVDIDTMVETYEPIVAEMVLYNTAATGNDLSSRNTYFNVPAEITTAVKWVDPINGLDTNTGTKASSWKSLTKAETSATLLDTIYRKSGSFSEASFFYPRTNKTWRSIGNAVVQSSGTTYAIGNDTTAVNITGFTFDGQTMAGVVGAFYSESKLYSCRFINPKLSSFLVNILADNAEFYNCIFVSPSGYGKISSTKNFKIESSIIKSQIIAATAAKTYQFINNRIIVNNPALDWHLLSVSADLIINGGNIDVVSADSLIRCNSASDLTNTVKITNTKINITDLSFAFLRLGANSYEKLELTNCVIVNNSSNKIINSSSSTNYLIRDFNILNNQAVDGLSVTKATAKASSVTINNGVIRLPVTTAGYGIGIGNESTTVANNSMTIDISSIKLYGVRYYTPGSISSPHGVFIGFQNKSTTKYLYSNGTGYGIGFKGDNTDGIQIIDSYGIHTNSAQWGVIFDGVKNTSISNKLLINNNTEFYYIKHPVGTIGATGQKIKNCIAINEGGLLHDMDSASAIGNSHSIDYNIYYSNAARPFVVAGVAKTFAEWQALGYDTHSIMLSSLAEAKALFVDYDNMNFALSENSLAIGFGQNLGEPYNVGLDASTNWGNETQLPNVITKQQPILWDCGAYIH